MNATELEVKLATLTNRPTRYELVATHDDGRRFLVGYTARRSRLGMLECIRNNATQVLIAAGQPDTARTQLTAESPATVRLDGGWAIRFTGRTQREAFIAGELSRYRAV